MKLPLFTAISLALVLSACGDGKQNQDKRDANKQDRQDHHTDHDHSNDDQKKTPSKTKKPKTDPGTRSGSDDAVPDGVQVEPDAGEALVGSWMSACLDLDENSNTPLENVLSSFLVFCKAFPLNDIKDSKINNSEII